MEERYIKTAASLPLVICIFAAGILSSPQISVVFCGFLAITLFGYLPLYLKSRRIVRKDNALIFIRGVFVLRKTTLPDELVVAKTYITTPLMCLFSVRLTLYRFPAGTLKIITNK